MNLCNYCGRDDHGVIPCRAFVDHQAHGQGLINENHCLKCRSMHEKEEPAKIKEILICKNLYPRHAYMVSDKQIVIDSATGEHFAHYMFICPDCDHSKVTTLKA